MIIFASKIVVEWKYKMSVIHYDTAVLFQIHFLFVF